MGILSSSETYIHLSSLYIQPTRYCGQACSSCYVRAHSKSKNQISLDLLKETFNHFAQKKNSFANEILISIDTLPSNKKESEYLLSFFKFIIFSDVKSTIRLTVHTLAVLNTYLSRLKLSLADLETNIKMISFSNISLKDKKAIEQIKKYTLVNYNHLVDLDKDHHKEVDHIKHISKFTNSIYLMINKAPLENTVLTKFVNPKIKNQLNFFSLLYKENLPNLINDGCLRDSIQYKKTGYGCSSNISKIQLWPDGTISGCPYAKFSYGEPAHTLSQILENIRITKKEYDFSYCRISKAL